MSDKERYELLRKLLTKMTCEWDKRARKEISLGNGGAAYLLNASSGHVFNAIQKADEATDSNYE